MSNRGTLETWQSVRDLCEKYELPSNLETALRAEARNYEDESRRIKESLNSLQKTISSALDSAERNSAFWRESRFISQKAADISEKSAAIEVRVNTICVLIDLCADEICVRPAASSLGLSLQFNDEARNTIFGKMN